MRGADTFVKPGEEFRRGSQEMSTACYRGIDLSPNTLESLVVWDVAGHAERERQRLSSAYRVIG